MNKFTYIISILYLYIVLFLYAICAVVGGGYIVSNLFHLPIWVGAVIFIITIILTVPILIWIDSHY